MIPSDSRCAVADFALGLYDAPRPDLGRTDGPPEFRAPPCTRAAPSTPPEPAASFGALAVDVAFAVK